MKEGSVVYLRIWSVYCRSTGCPGSRAKGEFKSWQRRGTGAKNRTQESASRPGLEGVILLSLAFASFSIYFRGASFTQTARRGEEGVFSLRTSRSAGTGIIAGELPPPARARTSVRRTARCSRYHRAKATNR